MAIILLFILLIIIAILITILIVFNATNTFKIEGGGNGNGCISKPSDYVDGQSSEEQSSEEQSSEQIPEQILGVWLPVVPPVVLPGPIELEPELPQDGRANTLTVATKVINALEPNSGENSRTPYIQVLQYTGKLIIPYYITDIPSYIASKPELDTVAMDDGRRDRTRGRRASDDDDYYHRNPIYKYEDAGYNISIINCNDTINRETGRAYRGQLRTIKARAFQNLKSLEKIILSPSLRKIEDTAFADCVNLTCIDFQYATNLKEIGDMAFSSCRLLTHIDLRNTGVISIGAHVFSYCRQLETILFPRTLRTIENCAFLYCRNLTYIDLRTTQITTIEWFAFKECIKLEIILLPESVIDIAASVFKNCPSLKLLTIPSKFINEIELHRIIGEYDSSKLKIVRSDNWGHYGKFATFHHGLIQTIDNLPPIESSSIDAEKIHSGTTVLFNPRFAKHIGKFLG